MARKIDMINGTIWDKMIVFALPLAFTGVLQQLYNAADVAVLGRYVSSEAMSAVGNNVPIIGFIVSICMGLALGANVVVARFLGMRDPENTNKAVHTAFVTAVVFGITMAVLGELCTDAILTSMQVPEAVIGYSEQYLRVYLLGMPFISIYNFLAAVLRSQGDTQTPLWALLIASVFNIAANLFFVLALSWDVPGVALATALANMIAASILLFRLVKTTGPLHLELRKFWTVDKKILRSIIRIGWPAGLQGCVFSLSNLIIQSAINSLGPDAMAGSVAAFTIEINVYCFINAFGLAATTFVSQNYGANNLARCRRATWISMGLNFIVTFILLGIVLYFGRTLLGFFSQSQTVIEIGMIRILYVVVPEPINVIMETLSDAMRGYGYSLPPALLTLISICSVRIIWVYTFFKAKPTFESLMMVYPVSWIVATIGLALLYVHQQKLLKKNSL